ncbi:MAG: hypothetical protein WDZ54_06135 [Sneathiella sp.]
MSTSVGPRTSSEVKTAVQLKPEYQKTKLDIIIPVFDPGLPDDPEEMAEERIWPELRRAESVRFALNLKEELEKTGQFGAVRVAPNSEATGDLYVIGKILESNGKDVEIEVDVYDISGVHWYNEDYDHEVLERFHKTYRNKGKDPYQPIFEKAAQDLVEHLSEADPVDIAALKSVTEMRFGANFSEEVFIEYIREENGRVDLISLPSEQDPMLTRIRAIRIRDQLFIDNLQDHYAEFNADMATSYALWQEQSLKEETALDEAQTKATTQAIVGGLLTVLAIGLAVGGANSGNPGRSTAALAGGVVAGVGGVTMISESFRTSKESEFHADTIEELGESIDSELAPQVVEFEGETKKITGNAAKQFAEWRAFLKEIYEKEKTPETQL